MSGGVMGESLPTPESDAGLCGAQHPTNQTVVPCVLGAAHTGYHYSTTGCAGSDIMWADPPRKPTVEEAEAILTLVRGGWLRLELALDTSVFPSAVTPPEVTT